MNDLTCVEVSAARLPDYLDFFDHRAFSDNPRWASCYCAFPQHDPSVVHWPRATGPDNRASAARDIGAGRLNGVLAYRQGQVVGWCNAGPWSQYPMLQDEPEPDPRGTGVIFCFVVAPEARGQGVAKALLHAACDGLRARGLRSVRARPLKDAQGAAANHLGPLAMYLAAGFTVEHDTPDGAVFVRKPLAGGAP